MDRIIEGLRGVLTALFVVLERNIAAATRAFGGLDLVNAGFFGL